MATHEVEVTEAFLVAMNAVRRGKILDKEKEKKHCLLPASQGGKKEKLWKGTTKKKGGKP